MTKERTMDLNGVREMLVSNYGAKLIKTVKSQNKTKFEVVFLLSKDIASEIEKNWDFCSTTISDEEENFLLSVLLLPKEIPLFIDTFHHLLIPQQVKQPTIILRLPTKAPKPLICQTIKQALRPHDHVRTDRNEIIIILENCNDIEPVERRIRDILSHVPFNYENPVLKVIGGTIR